MARARNIKPAIMANEELAEMEPLARLLFVYLWMLADREGRLEDRPKRIAAQAFPYDRAADVGAMLDQLHKAGFIARYAAGDVAVIQICNFHKHQAPHGTEKDSQLPNEEGLFTVHDRGKNGYSTGEFKLINCLLTVKKQSDNTLILGIMNHESGLRIHEPGAAAPSAPPEKKPKAKKTSIPETFGISGRVRTWAEENGFTRLSEHLEAFKRKAVAKGYTYVSWDDAFMEAIREDWAKLRGRTANGSPAAGERKTTQLDQSALYKPEPALTPEQLAANRENAAAALARLKSGGLNAIRQGAH